MSTAMFALVKSVNGKSIKTAVVADSELKINLTTNKTKAMLRGRWNLVEVIIRHGRILLYYYFYFLLQFQLEYT